MNDLQDLADVVAQAIDTATAPLLARIAVLEKRALVHGRDGRDGKDAAAPDLDQIAAKVVTMIPSPRDGRDGEPAIGLPGPQGEAGRDGRDAQAVDLDQLAAKAAALVPVGRDGRDGKDVDLTVIAGLQTEIVRLKSLLEALPAPRDGKDGASVDPVAVESLVAHHVKAAVLGLPVPKDGRDGRDVDPILLETVVAARVGHVLAEWERPADGKSLTPDDVAPLIAAEVAKSVAAIPAAKDGRGIHAAFITHDGELALTFSDGGQTKVGPVVGPPGKDADMAALAKQISDDIAKIPAPKDGEPGRDGKDGADGLGIDDLDLIDDPSKGYVLRWANAAKSVDKPFPFPIERGVYKPGTIYHKSSLVTVRGSWWIALQETADRPGESKAWRMVVKSGRDGRDVRREGGDV